MKKVFAPIIIPTLNRFDHFKRCLESLERCSWSELTDVYVGLDYPPSDKYVSGWKKIDLFLREKENNNHFNSLTVFRRDHNLGIANENSNASQLVKYVTDHYDAFIFTEDDNIFSPNFLEYINKGLIRYENDESVFAIIGYSHPYHFKQCHNNHFRHSTDMSVWGVGYWTHRWKKMFNYVENGYLRRDFSIRNVIKAKKHGWLRLFDYIHYCYHKGYVRVTDGVMATYLIANNLCVIIPTMSKVRNIGWDNSGNSTKTVKSSRQYEDISKKHMTQDIDKDVHFEYYGNDTIYMDYNDKVAVRESDCPMSFWGVIKQIVKSI